MKKVRVGIIGCGWFGNVHLDNLLKMDGAEVCALATGNKERLAETGKKVPAARLYEDYHDMLAKEALDAVIICVTPDRHEDIEEICCEKGIPFYVEKPIGVSRDKIVKTINQVRRSGIITAVGYQERYNPAIEEIKWIVAGEAIGIVDGSWMGTMPGPLWWRTKKSSGGQIIEQTTHLFDMFRYLFGEVKSVYATGGRNHAFDDMPHDTEDYSTTVMTFENGIVGTLHSASYLKSDSASQVGFRIVMPERVIQYEWNKQMQVTSHKKTEIRPIEADSHFVSLQTFIEAVQLDAPNLIRSPYEDGARSCLLTIAANESLESGKVIKLM